MMCLYRLSGADASGVEGLFITASEQYGRSSQHGVRMGLVEKQAQRLDLPLHTVWLPRDLSMDAYDRHMEEALEEMRARGITRAVYGDVFLEQVRTDRERRLARVGMRGQFPLWQQSTETLARSFVDAGFRAVVVCVSAQQLPPDFVGRPFDHAFLEDLPDSVDPCGEHGEFHTFVYDGPLFSESVSITRGEVVYRTYDTGGRQAEASPCSVHTANTMEPGVWYCDLLPRSSDSTGGKDLGE